MTRRLVSSGSPFERQAGYSRAVAEAGLVHVSGTTGYDYATMTMPDDVGAQARNALLTIGKALAEAGSSLEKVVRVRIYVTAREHANAVFAETGATFGEIRPAMTIVVCGLLTDEMKVEIEATATL